MKEVPFCDCFSVEEECLVLSPSPTANCCILRVLIFIVWHKSTMFKGKITSGTMKGAKQFWIEFVEWTKKRNLNFKEKKAP